MRLLSLLLSSSLVDPSSRSPSPACRWTPSERPRSAPPSDQHTQYKVWRDFHIKTTRAFTKTKYNTYCHRRVNKHTHTEARVAKRALKVWHHLQSTCRQITTPHATKHIWKLATVLEVMSWCGRPTHHVFLVLLEVCVDKEATGGINKRVLHVVDTLVPARGQRGGSCGHLVEAWETQMQGDFLSLQLQLHCFTTRESRLIHGYLF